MYDIPDYIVTYLQSSLLGRLKLNLYWEISKRKNYFPGPHKLKSYIIDISRSNFSAARILASILGIQHTSSIDFNMLNDSFDMNILLSELKDNPLEDEKFVQINNCSEEFPPIVGVLILCEDNDNYRITLIEENNFPRSIISCIDISISSDDPEKEFRILGKDTTQYYSSDNYKDSDLILFATSILNHLNNNRSLKYIKPGDNKDIEIIERYEPPMDSKLMNLLKLAKHGKIGCTLINLQLDEILPYDFEFCTSFPQNLRDRMIHEIKIGKEIQILVYWNGTNFIMSDDYSTYLAYKYLKYNLVPVVVLGEYPKRFGEPIKKGGIELIPDVIVSRSDADYDSLDPKVKNWILDKKLNLDNKSEGITSSLYVLFLCFANLIQSPTTKEKELHEFLKNHPTILDAYGYGIMSEVKLGNKYRVDLILQYKHDDKRIILIELEKASLKIFTKSGRPRAHVTHALQQVEDWLRWWRENPNDVPKPLDSSIYPEGLVVIGRNSDMDEDTRARLLGLNQNHHIKIITYDDLLERIKTLIDSLELLLNTN